MNLPRTITQPATSPEPTVDWRSEEVPPRPASERFKVALVHGSKAPTGSTLEAQLRKRLWYVAVVGMLAFGFHVVMSVLLFDSARFSSPLEYLAANEAQRDALVVAGIEALAVAVLSARRSCSFRGLRWLELLVLVPVVAWLSLDSWRGIHLFARTFQGVEFIMINAYSLGWALLILIYGILIPNTWRRCAIIVGLMGLTGFAVNLTALSRFSLSASNFIGIASNMTVWFGVAGAIVTLGAYRVQVLRQEAAEARKLGQYILKRRLGTGGMGEVYLAEHVLLRRPCALKLIRPERVGDEKHLLRFEREVMVTATLTHPNTVQIFDYGRAADGTFYYVMEYLPGLTLEEIVKQYGPLPPARAVYLLRQLCGALREAHRVGLIHRDIKPGNVMVCERGGVPDIVKLLDFGLVLPQAGTEDGEKLTQQGAIAGTPAYMSPEQAGGQEDLDARSDLYSVGALAYFLLTGQPPFAGRSAVKMLAAQLYEEPVPVRRHRPDLPEDLEAVILRCLAKSTRERFPDAANLDAALAECACGGQWSPKEASAWWSCRAERKLAAGAAGVAESLA
jgi:serine/threonine-protein kinase